MAHLLKSSPVDKELPVVWNVDQSVGQKGSNLREDVVLVQYLLNAIAKSPTSSMGWELRKLLSFLLPNGICDDYTIDCIKRVQTVLTKTAPNTTVDGKISRAAPGLWYGGGYYTIVSINAMYRRNYWPNWPCISMDCENGEISKLVYRELYGKEP